jgi:hypothetical protein
MADGIVSTDPFVNLYLDHADIRREASEHTSDLRREQATDTATIRREASEHTSDIRHEVANEAHRVNSDVKDGQWKVTTAIAAAATDLAKQLDSDTDRISAQMTADTDRIAQRSADYFINTSNKLSDNAIQLAGIKATTDLGMARLQFDIQSAADKAVAASQLEAAKLSGSMALGHAQLERSILQDGNETRKLINEIDRGGLERRLIERNADLHGYRHEADRWRGHYDQAQFAALSSQMQAVNSNVAATRSDLVNFGTMTNSGQSTTSNQVR